MSTTGHVRRSFLSMTAVVALGVTLSLSSGTILRSEPAESAQHDERNSFRFALIGDMPYGPEGDAKFPNVIADINADHRLAFVVHDGDIKNGSSLCSDAMFDNRLTLFNQFAGPLIYIPGDNEWTDCHRANNGAYDPIERLALLRSLFFSTPDSLGRRTMTLERQSSTPEYFAYSENVRWEVGDVLFIGLHVVGSNNNFGGIPGVTVPPSAEYVARNAANLAWLRESFGLTRARNVEAVMIIIQANPNFELPATDARRSGFNDFLAALESETIASGKPVVLVHGDSHYFRIDKPMIGTRSRRRVENFTRVETFGELDNHWLHATVHPGNPNVFVFDQRIVEANLIAQ